MDVRTLRTEGLGDSTYLLTRGGLGVLVDPQRDVDRALGAAEEADVELRYVLETHLHNDYVSGAPEAARRTGAELVLPAGTGAAYPHTPAFHGEELPAGDGLALLPLHTPGHTPEHTSYVVLLDGQPVGVFSGGSLLAASAGRTDLLGNRRARQLARLQYGSLRRLASLGEDVALYPTHGQGSFCTSTSAGRTTSTIGKELADNEALGYADADDFADRQLAGLQPYPRYYAHMGPINLLGPPPLPDDDVRELAASELAQVRGAVHLVDVRPHPEFARGHIPGALNIELADDFGPWAGWLLPFNAPLVLVAGGDSDVHEAIVQLRRIGFDDVRGVLRGLDGWRAEHRPLRSHRTADVDQFTSELERRGARQMLDVRSPAEWSDGHVDGSAHRYVPDLVDGVPAQLSEDAPVLVACATGHRASMAASILADRGYEPVVLSGAGVPEVLQAGGPARAQR